MLTSSFGGMPLGNGSSTHGDMQLRDRERRRRSMRSDAGPVVNGHSAEANQELPISEMFPEVPSSEQLVEKVRSMLGSKVGTLYITRNYLCWSGIGRATVVMHFGEIVKLEKASKFLDSIEVMATTGHATCDEDISELPTSYKECSACRAVLSSSGASRGCRRCNVPLCPDCFQAHRSKAVPQDHVKHTLRPVDLDRVYCIIMSLWKAHLRIPRKERVGRPAAPPSPPASETANEGGDDPDVPLPDNHTDAPLDELLKRMPYNDDVQEDFYSELTVLYANSGGDTLMLPDTTLSRVFAGIIRSECDFCKNYRLARKDEDFQNAVWRHPRVVDKPDEVDKSMGTRLITYISKTPLGKKKVFETQRFYWMESKLTLHTSTQCPDVTFGSSFRTETLHEFEVDGSGVRVSNWYNVMWKKNVGFMRSTIQRAAEKAVSDTFPLFFQMVKKGVAGTRRTGGGARSAAGADAAADDTPEEEAAAEGEAEGTTAVSIDSVRFWCAVALGLAVCASILVAVSSVDSNLIQQLPQLRSVHAELNAQVHRLQRDGSRQHVSAQRLLSARQLQHDAAVPILYELLEREITRFLWMRWLATLSCTLTLLVGGATVAARFL